MTSTTTPLPGAAHGTPGLDGRLVLEAIVERRRAADAAEADQLA